MIRLILGLVFAAIASAQVPWIFVQSLPGLCRVGESYFLTTAAPGSQLFYCSSPNNYTAVGSGSGSVSAGSGITVVGSTVSADTAVILSRATAQAGTSLKCATSTSASAAVCSLTPTLTAYTDGMLLLLDPHATLSASATLNVDTLGARKLYKMSSGAAAQIGASDVLDAGKYIIAYSSALDAGTGGFFVVPLEGSAGITFASPYMISGSSYYLPMGFAATLPPTASWVDRNYTGTFTTSGLGGAIKTTSPVTSNSMNIKGRAIGSTTILTAAVVMFNQAVATNNLFTRCSVGVQQPAGEIATVDLLSQGYGAVNGPAIAGTIWTNPTTVSTGWGGSHALWWAPTYIKIDLAGSNITWYVSPSGGNDWVQMGQTTQTAAFGTTLTSTDEWVFAASGDGTNAAHCQLLSWSVQ